MRNMIKTAILSCDVTLEQAEKVTDAVVGVFEERPPNPLDLAFWTINKEPRFDEEFFMEETRAFIKRNNPWERD